MIEDTSLNNLQAKNERQAATFYLIYVKNVHPPVAYLPLFREHWGWKWQELSQFRSKRLQSQRALNILAVDTRRGVGVGEALLFERTGGGSKEIDFTYDGLLTNRKLKYKTVIVKWDRQREGFFVSELLLAPIIVLQLPWPPRGLISEPEGRQVCRCVSKREMSRWCSTFAEMVKWRRRQAFWKKWQKRDYQ
jgi:hypothetical protein